MYRVTHQRILEMKGPSHGCPTWNHVNKIQVPYLSSPQKIDCLHGRTILIKRHLKEMLLICNIDNAFFLFREILKMRIAACTLCIETSLTSRRYFSYH